MARRRRRPITPSPLGALIQRYREQRGLSRAALAAAVRVDPATVGHWEDDAVPPSGLAPLRLRRALRFAPPDDAEFQARTGLGAEDLSASDAMGAVWPLMLEDDPPHATLAEVAQHLDSVQRLVYLGAHDYAAAQAERLATGLCAAVRTAVRSERSRRRVVPLTVQALQLQAAALRDLLPSRLLQRALGPLDEAIDLATATRSVQPDQLAGLLDERALIKRMQADYDAAKSDTDAALAFAEAPGMRRQVYINAAMLALDDPATGDFTHLLQLGDDQIRGPALGEERFVRSRTQEVWARGIARQGSRADGDRALAHIAASRLAVDQRRVLDSMRLDIDEAMVRLRRRDERSLGICLALCAWEQAGATNYPFQQERIARLLAPYGGLLQLRAGQARRCQRCGGRH